MSRMGVFQIPSEFKDEDKWFKYFTKKQAIVIFLTLFLDYQLITWAVKINLLLVSILIALLFSMVSIGIVMIHLPVDRLCYSGGGLTLDQWLLRILIRRKTRTIYVKHYKEVEV